MAIDGGPSVDVGGGEGGGGEAPADGVEGVQEGAPLNSTNFGPKDIFDFLEPTTGDENGNEEEGKEKAGQEAGQGSDDVLEGEEGQTAKDAPRILTFKSGDKAVELSDDAQIQVTVDGKKETVTLRDLEKNYAGKIGFERKFQQLAEDKKAFKTDVEAIDNKLDKVFRALKKDFGHGLKELYEMAGEKIEGEPLDHFIKEARRMISEFDKLSPEEQKMKRERLKLDEEKEDFEKTKSKRENERIQAEADKYANELCGTHEITGEIFNQTWERLQKVAADMVKDGLEHPFKGANPKALTDLVVNRVLLDRHEMSVQGICKSIDSKVGKEALGDIRTILEDHMKAEKRFPTKDEIEFVAREYLGKPGARAGATKQRSEGQIPPKQSVRTKPGTPPKRRSDVAEGDEDYSNFGSLLRTIGANSN